MLAADTANIHATEGVQIGLTPTGIAFLHSEKTALETALPPDVIYPPLGPLLSKSDQTIFEGTDVPHAAVLSPQAVKEGKKTLTTRTAGGIIRGEEGAGDGVFVIMAEGLEDENLFPERALALIAAFQVCKELVCHALLAPMYKEAVRKNDLQALQPPLAALLNRFWTECILQDSKQIEKADLDPEFYPPNTTKPRYNGDRLRTGMPAYTTSLKVLFAIAGTDKILRIDIDGSDETGFLEAEKIIKNTRTPDGRQLYEYRGVAFKPCITLIDSTDKNRALFSFGMEETREKVRADITERQEFRSAREALLSSDERTRIRTPAMAQDALQRIAAGANASRHDLAVAVLPPLGMPKL